MDKAELLGSVNLLNDKILNSGIIELLRLSDSGQGGSGCHIIVGNVARVAPDGFYYGAIDAVTDAVVISELKVGATLIVAGAVGGEETFKTVPLTLPQRWLPFSNKITSIKLTGAADTAIAWLKPLV